MGSQSNRYQNMRLQMKLPMFYTTFKTLNSIWFDYGYKVVGGGGGVTSYYIWYG